MGVIAADDNGVTGGGADGGGAEDASAAPEVVAATAPAHGSLMRILLAWSRAVDSRTHESLK